MPQSPLAKRYYPALSTIVSADDIPDILGFLQSGVTDVFDRIHFKDLQYSKSPKGDAAFYSLKIVAANRIDIEIPGTGIFLIFNPNNHDAQISTFPVTVQYHWKVLAFFRDFDIQKFSFTPDAVFQLLLRVLNISEEQALGQFILQFVEPSDPLVSPLTQFVMDINQSMGYHIDLPDESTTLSDIVKEIYAQSGSNYSSAVAFSTYILSNDLQETQKRLGVFFRKFLEGKLEIFINDIITPSAKATFSLSAAVEFPRKILQPVYDASGQNPLNSGDTGTPFTVIPADPDGFPKVNLHFGEVSFYADTQEGFGYYADLVINTSLPAQLGETGLIMQITKVKLDLSRTRNIIEADRDGRPPDFIGAYLEQVLIILSPKWFKNQSSTLGILGRNLLIGTGGISGEIGIAVLPGQSAPPSGEMQFLLGNKSQTDAGKGFRIGFKKFRMSWLQNRLIESEVEGSFTIPKFRQCIRQGDNWVEQTGELSVAIQAFFEEDGDFRISAKPAGGLSICLPKVFIITIDELAVGKDEQDVYVELAGSLRFDNNPALYKLIDQPLHIHRLRIDQKGHFELEGGKIVLSDSVSAKLGPSEVSITAIHLGSHEQEHQGQLRQYKYFGFDGGISVNPGSMQADGTGVKFYFTTDDDETGLPHHHFLRLDSLAIDLQFPAGVSPDKATLIARGFLAMKASEFTGDIKFTMPQMKIAGGAGMRYNKEYPAFLIDTTLEFSNGLPFAATGLAFYGIRGLFGMRYIAAKDATTPPSSTWVEYYNAGPEKGVHLQKFKTPDATAGTQSPLSIAAGISLATQADGGRAFSSQMLLLLSLPNLILLEGKANIMGERLGLTEGNAPFYTLLVIEPGESVRIAMGADYQLPTEGSGRGKILILKGEVDSAFSFKDPKAWFIDLGKPDKRITGRLLSLFDCYTYLMIRPQFLEAGAGLSFGFNKKYAGGVVKAAVRLYFDIRGRISFTNIQIGGYIGAGGLMSISLFGIGLSVSIAMLLTVEAPGPFRIFGELGLTVGVNLLVKKVEKSFTIKFNWEKKAAPPPQAIYPLPPAANDFTSNEEDLSPAKGVHLNSGKIYRIQYFGTDPIGDTQADADRIQAVIPLDTVIEIQLEKGVKPSAAVSALIGNVGNRYTGYAEVIPPVKGARQERHTYTLEDIALEYWDNGWKSYHPYEALDVDKRLSDPAGFKIGDWLKTGPDCNKLRIPAQTPFDYMQDAMPGWYIPEQMGLTGTTMFCEGSRKTRTCLHWQDADRQEFRENRLYQHGGIAFKLLRKDGRLRSESTASGAPGEMAVNLCFDNGGALEVYFPEPVLEVDLQLNTTHSQGVEIAYYGEIWQNGPDGAERKTYQLLQTVTKSRAELSQPVTYRYGTPQSGMEDLWQQAVSKVVIRSFACDEAALEALTLAVDEARHRYYQETDSNQKADLLNNIRQLEQEIMGIKANCCPPGDAPEDIEAQIQNAESRLRLLIEQQRLMAAYIETNCNPKAPDYDEKHCAEKQTELRSLNTEINDLQTLLTSLRELADLAEKAGCRTCVSSICWLTLDDFVYNLDLLPQRAIDEEFRLMQEALESHIVPILQPDTIFRIKLTLKDSYRGYSGSTGSGQEVFYLGYRTAGPLGHFPEDRIPLAAAVSDPPALTGLDASGADAPENRLKYYLDYEHSYPKADGDLTYAKQLYYGDPYPAAGGGPNPPRLLLFYSKKYAHHFFGKWQSGAVAELIVEIRDPLETSDELSTSVAVEEVEISVKDFFGVDALDPAVQMLNRIPKPCIGLPETAIDPKDRYLSIRVENLKPRKLYTAVLKNKYFDGNRTVIRTVHNYNFLTSEYKSFRHQIESNILQRNEVGDPVRQAVFIEHWRLSLAQVFQARVIMAGAPLNNDLDARYTDDFDRLLYGNFGILAFPAQVTTEINIIRNTDAPQGGDPVLGLWIRSPEAFNDPRIPAGELKTSVQLVPENGTNPVGGMMSIFSRDASQVFIMHGSGAFSDFRKLRLKFEYLEWNGKEYLVKDTCFLPLPDIRRKRSGPFGPMRVDGPLKRPD